MKQLFGNVYIRLLLPPLAGFVFYGAWAYWVNMDFGVTAGAKAAFTQGSYSLVITLVLALLIEWLYSKLRLLHYGHWIVGLIACLLMYSTSWGVNALAGTPNIPLTILPGATFSTVYTALYIVALVNSS